MASVEAKDREREKMTVRIGGIVSEEKRDRIYVKQVCMYGDSVSSQ